MDPEHNLFGEEWLSPDAEHCREALEKMTQPAYQMDRPRRQLVFDAIREVCRHRDWTLHALHVRALHIHVVVAGEAKPERMMNDFKAYASRALNRAGFDSPDRRRWTRHGSTRYIYDEKHLAAVINYVLNKQGDPMERWPDLLAP